MLPDAAIEFPRIPSGESFKAIVRFMTLFTRCFFQTSSAIRRLKHVIYWLNSVMADWVSMLIERTSRY